MKFAPLLSLILVWGAFSFPALAFGLTGLSSAGAVDAILTDQTTFNDFGRASTSGYRQIGWGYKPSASHNICTVAVGMKATGNPTDSVRLQLRHATTTAGSGVPLTSTGTVVGTANASWQVRGGVAAYEYTFFPCAVVAGEEEYIFVLTRTGDLDDTDHYGILIGGTGTPTITGTAEWLIVNFNAAGAMVVRSLTAFPTDVGDIVLNGSENFGVTDFEPPSLPYGNIDDSNASSTLSLGLGSFINIPAIVGGRFPFNWLVEMGTLLETLESTTTSEFPLVTLNLSDVSSTTATIFPDDITLFSTSTVTHFLPVGFITILRTLMAAVIWVGFGTNVFFSLKTAFS